MSSAPEAISFDQGQTPTIAMINKATIPLGVDFQVLTGTLQKTIDTIFAPIWGAPAKLQIAPTFIPKAWAMVFTNDADEANALGYHDLTPDGLPISKVFVKTTLAAGEKVSVTASHEAFEMLLDPAINMWFMDAKGTLWAGEASDAVEAIEFPVDGVAMSDFVTPAYFESFRKAKSARFDYCNKVTKPFQILKGGYSIISKGGRISNIFGSKAKEKAFAQEDRRGHRSEQRSPPGEAGPRLRCSKPKP